MQAIENVNVFVTGVFPDAEADNSTTAVSQDGFEFIAEYINNSVIGNQQDWLDYAGLTPNGVTEAAGQSQVREAIQLGHGIGPGTYKQWGKFDDPSVTGDRILLLSGQGVLRASYTPLDVEVYVGDGNNPTAPFFYHADDAAGTIRNIAGAYLILPKGNPNFSKYAIIRDEKADTIAGGGFTSGAWQTRTLNVLNENIGGETALSSNQLTLSAGTYKIDSTAPAWRVGVHQSKLYNITDAADEILGDISEAGTSGDAMTKSSIKDVFTITDTKVFEIQHQCFTTRVTDGFGLPGSFGSGEVYTQAVITKMEDFIWGITY